MADRRFAPLRPGSVPTLDLEIPSGRIAGLTDLDKYALNPAVGLAPVLIAPTGDIVVPTSAQIHNIKSTNAADTGNVEVEGVDGNFQLQMEIVPVNGTGGGNTAKSYLFIHRKTYQGHAELTNVGNITATAVVDGTETSRIAAGKGQTQIAMFLIPALDFDGNRVEKAYLSNMHGGILKTMGTTTQGLFQLQHKPFQQARHDDEAFTLSTVANISHRWVFSPWKSFPPKGFISMTAETNTSTNTTVFGGFQVIIDARPKQI